MADIEKFRGALHGSACGDALGYPLQKLTTAQQTHEDHVVAVGPAEIGCGAGSVAK